jgi:hypothetical protein
MNIVIDQLPAGVPFAIQEKGAEQGGHRLSKR